MDGMGRKLLLSTLIWYNYGLMINILQAGKGRRTNKSLILVIMIIFSASDTLFVAAILDSTP